VVLNRGIKREKIVSGIGRGQKKRKKTGTRSGDEKVAGALELERCLQSGRGKKKSEWKQGA